MSIPSYAVGLLTEVDVGPGIVEYLERIDATLAPFGGEFIIHGAEAQEKEDTWPGALIVIRFPDAEGAARWYDSADYQKIIPLRAENSRGYIALFAGLEPGHQATDVLN